VLLPLTLAFAPRETNAIPASAWAGFLYLALVSQYLGFFAWYHGLALGGIARAGQAQLLQPFMTLVASALLIGEALRADEIFFAAMVVALVALGRRMPVRRA
jgi:drug/metabolite transporter (DMT)-like permease